MISKYKRVGCFVLSLVLMFLLFATPIVQPKADAFAITASVATISIVVSLLALLGISFATVDAAKAGADSFVRTNPDILSWVDNVKVGSGCPGDPGFSPDGKPSIFFNAANTAGLVTFFNKAKEFFNKKGDGNVEVVDPAFGFFGDVKFTKLTTFSSSKIAYDIAPYSYLDYTNTSPLKLSVNGVPYNYGVSYEVLADGRHCAYLYKNGDIINCHGLVYFQSDRLAGFHHLIGVRFGFMYVDSTSYSYLVPYLSWSWVDNIGKINYDYKITPFPDGASFCCPVSGDGITPVKTSFPYKNSPKYDPQSVIDQLLQTIEKQGSVTVDYKKTLDAIENNQDTQIQIDQEQLVTEIGIKDKLDEIAQNQPKPEEDMTVPKLPSLGDKFPFCIPFDLIALVGVLNAKSVVPKWDIPFYIKSINYRDSISLDFTQFEVVADVCRITITIIFILGLILITRKIIQG